MWIAAFLSCLLALHATPQGVFAASNKTRLINDIKRIRCPSLLSQLTGGKILNYVIHLLCPASHTIIIVVTTVPVICALCFLFHILSFLMPGRTVF